MITRICPLGQHWVLLSDLAQGVGVNYQNVKDWLRRKYTTPGITLIAKVGRHENVRATLYPLKVVAAYLSYHFKHKQECEKLNTLRLAEIRSLRLLHSITLSKVKKLT